MTYLDYAATAPLAPGVLGAMLPYFSEHFGNPSTLYAAGRAARCAVETARAQVAGAIGAHPEEIYFTGGGTEADNWAVSGALALFSKRRVGRVPHIITTPIEHHATLRVIEAAETLGAEVSFLPVDADGLSDVSGLFGLLRSTTALVSVMAANNEVGTLQPVEEAGRVMRGSGVLFHTDAVQAVGHIPVHVDRWGVDLLSLAAHKFGGPKGVGALYIRRGVALPSFIHGGAQERGRRPGTENIAAIVGCGEALARAVAEMEAESRHLTVLRDKLIAGVLSSVPRSRLTGHPAARLPGSASFVIECVEGESLILRLDAKGFCVSSGSACTSGDLDPSHVLLAMGLPHELAHGSLRCTLGFATTETEIDNFLAALPEVVADLRRFSPKWVE